MYDEDCSMELERRFANLARRCLELDDEIHGELRAPRPDQVRVDDLKRQMLRLKGQMAAMGGAPMAVVSPFAVSDQVNRGSCVSQPGPSGAPLKVTASRCTMASNSSGLRTISMPSVTSHSYPIGRAYRFASAVATFGEAAGRMTRAIVERMWRGFENAPTRRTPFFGSA